MTKFPDPPRGTTGTGPNASAGSSSSGQGAGGSGFANPPYPRSVERKEPVVIKKYA
ncbi:MAG: hypothetical protein RL291_624, partial [Pseudomonadota bacterium]